jgi:hypothetical protein
MSVNAAALMKPRPADASRQKLVAEAARLVTTVCERLGADTKTALDVSVRKGLNCYVINAERPWDTTDGWALTAMAAATSLNVQWDPRSRELPRTAAVAKKSRT